MNAKTETVMNALNDALSDSFIEEELRSIFRQCEGPAGVIEIELNERFVPVPIDAKIEVLTKTFVRETYDLGFSTGYRAQVAIGGVAGGTGHQLVAVYCFATLFFNADCQRITVDFFTKAAWL
jgi:hypothetical protein